MYNDVQDGYEKWDRLLQQSNTSHLACNNLILLNDIELLHLC